MQDQILAQALIIYFMNPAKDIMEHAVELIRGSMFNQALEQLSVVEDASPKDRFNRLVLSVEALFGLENYSLAHSVLSDLLSCDELDQSHRNIAAALHMRRGVCNTALGDHKSALLDYEMAVALFEDSQRDRIRVQYRIAFTHSLLGNHKAAMAIWESFPEAMLEYAKACIANKEYTHALGILPRECFMLRGLCFEQLEDYQKAVDNFTQIPHLHDLIESVRSRAKLQERSGPAKSKKASNFQFNSPNQSDTAKPFMGVETIHVNQPSLRYCDDIAWASTGLPVPEPEDFLVTGHIGVNFAACLLHSGDAKSAEDVLVSTLKDNQENSWPLASVATAKYILGIALLLQRKYKKALKVLDSVIGLLTFPGKSTSILQLDCKEYPIQIEVFSLPHATVEKLFVNRAFVLARLSRFEVALSTLEFADEFVNTTKLFEKIQSIKGVCYENLGDYARALDYCDDSMSHMRLLVLMHRYSEALAISKEIKPKTPMVCKLLAECYYHAGEYKWAADQLEEFERLVVLEKQGLYELLESGRYLEYADKFLLTLEKQSRDDIANVLLGLELLSTTHASQKCLRFAHRLVGRLRELDV